MTQRLHWQVLAERSARSGAVSGLLFLATSGCSKPLDSFNPVTPQGRAISALFIQVMALSALVLLAVTALIFYVLTRYRAGRDEREPSEVEGRRGLEIAWTILPAVLLGGLFVLTLQTMNAVDAASPSALRVKVVGHQWWWEYQYPDLGIRTANELHLPTGAPLKLEIEAADVIHSFWVPQFGWKRDAIPSRTNVMWVQVDQPGAYEGACTEYCGLQHAWMRVYVVAEGREQFEAWAERQREAAAPAEAGPTTRGLQVFLQNTCVNCHTVRGTPASGQLGPDLTHVGGRSTLGAGVLPNTAQNMQRWIQDAQAIKPGALMPAYAALADEELRALVDYLESLK
ncbi:MAG TPA: cytochrome c oxidase subunit II [Chloroflexota bacterium]|nr:cytochrome c oxidase subunit II [Chloroflexota bacterium]